MKVKVCCNHAPDHTSLVTGGSQYSNAEQNALLFHFYAFSATFSAAEGVLRSCVLQQFTPIQVLAACDPLTRLEDRQWLCSGPGLTGC